MSVQWAGTLTGEVILPADPRYDAARRVWNLDVDRRPAAIVRCSDEADVVRAVDVARGQGLAVAVRSGGHSQAGHAVCDAGLVIDLCGLDVVDVDSRSSTVRVGAGTRVGALLDAVRPQGIVIPTGGCPDVGIGGLTLGGGQSYLMARHGAVCDNVLSARVVTAAGQRLTASPQQNADLFWALRGGGGNFGIVTEFTFAAQPLDRVLAGRLVFPVDRAGEVMRRYRDLTYDSPDELQTSGGNLSSDGEPAFFIALCHCGGMERANRLVERWRQSLQPESDTVAWTPYSADFLLPAVASSGTGAFLAEMSDEVIDGLADAFAAAPPSCTAAWNHLHGAVTRPAVDAMAFPLRQPGFDFFAHAGWKTEDLRQVALQWLNGWYQALRPWARGAYVNSLGDEPPARTAEAYGVNYGRLRTVKAAYDPGNLFHHNHNIPPAA